MKKFGLLMITVLLVSIIAACGARNNAAPTDNAASSSAAPASSDNPASPSASASPSADDKVYKFGTDAQYSPMEMMDKDKIIGFDADFLDSLMKEAGLKYELVNTGWDPMLISVKDGTEYAGGISSVSITDERKQSYDYSIPYFESTNMIMTKKGSGVKSAADIKDKKVAVQTGTTADIIMSKIMGQGSTKLRRFESNTLAFQEMDQNGVDAVVADIAIVNEYLKQNPNKNYEGAVDPANFPSEFYGILLPKGSPLKAKLDPAIKTVLENGKYVEIYKRWMGSEPNVQNVLNAK